MESVHKPSDPGNILVVITNHNLNDQAIQLKNDFLLYCETKLIDSGSNIKKEQLQYFDHLLPNVYYSGLLNKAFECLQKSQKTILLFVASDVQIPNYRLLLQNLMHAFNKLNVGVYAPSADYSCHAQMQPKASRKLRKVTFTDGFCFAVSKDILSGLCPVDTKINYLGHGLDIYLGYLAMASGKHNVVDHDIIVIHPDGSGYNDVLARKQRDRWYRTKSGKSRIFHCLASIDWLKNNFGLWLLRMMF